ncbi:9463_t:CDS:2, partial [Acaulospora colombiana]
LALLQLLFVPFLSICPWLNPSFIGAGEIHSINGGPKDDAGQRIHVIKASSTDLWASTWSYAGRLAFPNRDVWSIDPTVLKLNGNNYVIYSTQDSGAQCLFIAYVERLSSLSLLTPFYRSQLTSPTTVGWNVNEGPVALYRNNRTWVAFSASLCSGTGYKLGLLEYIGGDPLNSSSWNKYSQPVLQSANGYTMAQPVEWNSDGTPRFQPPAPLSSNIPEPV